MPADDDKSLGSKIRAAEKTFARHLIKWRLRQTGQPLPDEQLLDKGSEQVVDQAHRIMRQRGGSLLDDLKKAKSEFLKASRDGDDES